MVKKKICLFHWREETRKRLNLTRLRKKGKRAVYKSNNIKFSCQQKNILEIHLVREVPQGTKSDEMRPFTVRTHERRGRGTYPKSKYTLLSFKQLQIMMN